MRLAKRRAGFTLVEILAALMFLAIAVPAILTAFSASSRGAESAERTILAGQLAEKQLNETVMQEIAAQSGGTAAAQSRGEFGAEYPGFRWELEQQPWTNDASLTEYTVRVFFPVRGQERSVEISTLVAAAGTSI